MTAMMIGDGKRVAAGGARLQWHTIPIADIDLIARITRGEENGVASKTFRFADDKVVPREFSEEILCYQPSAQIVTIPGDHFALWKNAACWTETITRFAQGFAGSRPERDVSTVARL